MKNEVLYAERKKRNKSQLDFAEFLGIPYKTYVSYEDCFRTPRKKYMEQIMNKLEIKDAAVFFPNLHIIDDETEFVQDNIESVIRNICNYMNSMSKNRFYDLYEVSMIRRAVRAEYLERKFKKIKINPRDENGKKLINENAAKIANGYLKANKITFKDVELFKKCKLYEYEGRVNDKNCINSINEN